MSFGRNIYRPLVFLIPIIVLHAVAMWQFFGGCFNTFDTGGMLDSYWRVYNGQTIYTDFFIQIGPVLFYTLMPFLYAFGFTMAGLYAHVVFFSSLILIGTFLVFQPRVPLWTNVLITALTAVSFYMPFGFPWYTPMAHFWGMAAFLLIIHRYPFQADSDRVRVSCITGFLVVLSIFTKTNVGFFYICAIAGFWVLYVRNLKTFGWYAIGAVLAFLLVMSTVRDYTLFFHETIFVFGPEQGYRLAMLKDISNWFPKSYSLLALIILVGGWGHFRKISFELFLFGAGIFVAFADLRTSMSGSALTQMRGIIIGLGFIMLFKLLREYKSDVRTWIGRGSVALLCALSLAFGYKAFEVSRTKAIWAFGANAPTDYRIAHAPLKGWKVAPKIGTDLNNFTQYLKDNLSPDDNLLVADTEFLPIYTLLQMDSYKKLPIYWSTIYESKILHDMIVEEIEKNPPDWVIGYPSPESPERLHFLPDYLPKEFADDFILVKTGRSGFNLYKRSRN